MCAINEFPKSGPPATAVAWTFLCVSVRARKRLATTDDWMYLLKKEDFDGAESQGSCPT